MSKYIYWLKISCPSEEHVEKASSLLGVKPNKELGHIWCFEVEQKEDDEYFDFVKNYLDMLEGKYDQLESIGISRDDISVWMLYKYEGQCNMEFLPKDLKRLGDNGIALCISCWES